jgi:hypothetical protein
MRMRPIVHVILALLCVVVTLSWAVVSLQAAGQRSVPVEALTRVVNKYITAIDTTPRGIRYRWVPSDVQVTMPAPDARGVVTLTTWFWPDSRDTRVTIDGHDLAIAPALAAVPRRYLLLADTGPWSSQSTVSVHATGPKAFWAYTGMHIAPVTLIPHPTLLALYLGVLAVVCVIVWQWLPSVLWMTVLAHGATVLLMVQTNPLALYLPSTLARDDRINLLAGIVLTVAVLVWAPRARPWFRSASQAQRVTLLTTSMVCVAPVVALLYGPEPLTQRVTENRRLTAFPSAIPGDMAALADTTIQTEQWLSDHFGWRSLLIRTKNELDYRIFGTSSRVYYGSDDVIYMRRWSDERFPDLDAVLRDPQRRGLLLQRMRDRVAMYRAAGIVPIVVIAPSKEVIYPEYLPWYVAPYDTMLLRAFIVDLRAAGVTVIDAEQLLLDAKPQQPLLFHKQDFHWNSLAAHLVADAVLAEVAQVIPAQRPWRVPYRVVTAPSPFADRDFAGLLLDRYDVPAGVDIALDLPVTGEWRNTVVMGNAMDIWENTDPQVAFPAINLQIVGDSFSIRFIGAGFETAFPAIYRSFYPKETADYPGWLKEQRIGVVLWQLRDAGLTYFLDDIAEQ